MSIQILLDAYQMDRAHAIRIRGVVVVSIAVVVHIREVRRTGFM
jgi:hypothetical protein